MLCCFRGARKKFSVYMFTTSQGTNAAQKSKKSTCGTKIEYVWHKSPRQTPHLFSDGNIVFHSSSVRKSLPRVTIWFRASQ